MIRYSDHTCPFKTIAASLAQYEQHSNAIRKLADSLQALATEIGASPAPDSREACAPSYRDLPAVPLSKGQMP